MTKTKKQSGFTIIEILVVISILGILMGASIPGFRNYERNTRVRNSAKELRSFLWEAQSFSLSPKKGDIDDYSISFRQGYVSDTRIEIKDSDNDKVSFMYLGNDIEIENIILDGANELGLVDVIFSTGNKEGGKIEFDPFGNEMKIVLGSKITSLKYEIIINSVTSSIVMNKF